MLVAMKRQSGSFSGIGRVQTLSDHYERIDIHLGAHRTGTSSLQAALHVCGAQIRDAGKDFMAPPVYGLRSVGNHRPALRRLLRLIEKSEGKGEGLLRRLSARKEIRDALDAFASHGGRSNPQLIVSDENLLSSAIARSHPARLYPDAYPRLRAFSRVCGDNVGSVFLALRPYAEFLVSYTAMSSVFGKPRLAFDELDAWSSGQLIGWPALVEDIRLAFPKAEIRIWPYNTGSLPIRFQELTGVDGSVLPSEDGMAGRNPAPTLEAISQAATLRERESPEKEALDMLVASHSSGTIPRKEMFFSSRSMDRLDRLYSSHLDELRNHVSPLLSVAS